jgi:hypothetical protein
MKAIARTWYVAGLAALIIGFLPAGTASAALTVSPPQLSVPEGQTTTVAITYRFSGLISRVSLPYSGPMSSSFGEFRLGRGIVITVPTTVTATIQGGSGAVTETLTVPASVLDAARRQGATSFTFDRTFIDAPSPPFITNVASIFVSVTSEAAASFAIKRIELYFDNRRGETTVPRNRRGLKAYADIRFVGSGLLSGYWEVDGRRILDVNRSLSFGAGVTLSTPDSPDLPTFDTGSHVVRFVVVNPAFPVGLPQALYFVTPSEETLRQVKIVTPAAPPAEAGKGTRAFTWDRPQGIDLFLVEFSETPDGKPIFSAFAKENRYAIPPEGMEGVFTPGKRYFWRVKGYDGHENQVGASAPAEFVF